MRTKPSIFVRKDRYVPGVGRVLTMSDARKIVVAPTKRYENCSRLIDSIFNLKTVQHDKTVGIVLPGQQYNKPGPNANAEH